MVEALLSIVSGLLTGLAFDFPFLSFLIWFSLVPFLYVIHKSGLREGILCSFLFGLTYYSVSLFWIGNVTVIGLFFLVVYLACYPILFFLFGRHLLKRRFAVVTVSSLWVILEFLKEQLWCGFGWANIGYSQYANLYLNQVADLLGVKFISFVIAVVNIFLWQTLYTRRIFLRKTIFVILLIGFCIAYSFYRVNTLQENDFLKIAVVQPNMSEQMKQAPLLRSFVLRVLGKLAETTERSLLVVFPEAAWPGLIDNAYPKELEAFVAEIARDSLIGAVCEVDEGFVNAALYFDSQGNLIEAYHKIKLVPFGEYVPLRRYLRFIKVLNMVGDMSRGNEQKIMRYKDRSFSVLICFEDIFPSFVLKASRKRDFLINITNDSWFKGEPEATQHLGIMAMRAIENRISIVRCANTGISGWVSFKGTIERLRKDNQEVFYADVGHFNISLSRKRSFYNTYGEIFPLFCTLVFIASLIKQ